MRKGTITKTLAGLILAVTIAVPAALTAACPAHALDDSPPVFTDMVSPMAKGYACFENPTFVPGQFRGFTCFPPNGGGPIYVCPNPSFCYQGIPGQTVNRKTAAGTGIVTTSGGAQQTTTANAGTGIVTTPTGAQPTTTTTTQSAAISVRVASAGALAR